MALKSTPKPRTLADTTSLYLLECRNFEPLQQLQESGGLSDAQELRMRAMSKNRARQYRLSRWLLQKVLGETLPLTATGSIDIIERPDLPPVSPQAEAAGMHFSISHSSGYLAVALSIHGEVGLDMEWTAKTRRFLGIAQQYFSAAELSLLESADSENALASLFYLLWTQKEAYLKSRNLGLGAIPLSRICFKTLESYDSYDSDKPRQYPVASCFAFNNLQFSVVSRHLTAIRLIEVDHSGEDTVRNLKGTTISRYLYDDSAVVRAK